MGTYISGRGSGPNYCLHPSLVGTMASYHRIDDSLWSCVSSFLRRVVVASVGRDSVLISVDRQLASDLWLFIDQMTYHYANRRADSLCVKKR